jgi:hypothetical protein
MNTNEIRFYLHNYDNLKREVKHLQESLDQYRRMDISGIKAQVITDMPLTHSNTSKTENMALTRVDYIADLEEEIDSKMRLIRAVNSVYFYLEEPKLTIFEMRYFITPMENDIRKPKYSWKVIADEVGQTEETCRQIDCRIIRTIQQKHVTFCTHKINCIA